MHPVLRTAIGFLTIVGLCATAHADRLSVGFGIGAKIDANRLGETIATDGLDAAAPRIQVLPGFEGAGDPVPELAFLDQAVITSENTLVVFEDLGLISNLQQGGAMVALDIAVNVRYDFLDALFVRLGFNYNFKVSGGETTWDSPLGSHSQLWDYSAMAIPLHFGVNVPIQEGKYNVYAGLGLTWASGGFDLELKAPAGWYYVAANGADLGSNPFGNDENGNLVPATLGEINESNSIRDSAIGVGYIVGADAEIANNLNILIESETQYVAKMSEATAFNDQNAAFAFGAPKLAYPAIPGGTILRIGVKYHFMDL